MRMSELVQANDPKSHDRILMYSMDTRQSKTVTIGQLLALQQEAINIPCKYCGSRGHYDTRGNCGACGAPIED